jgi:tellurite methyltransferase
VHSKPRPPGTELSERLGRIDIYLFDQLLKGRFDHRRTVLDAGCGDGRNLVYLLGSGYRCFAIDRDRVAVERVRELFARLAPSLPGGHVCLGELDRLPWAEGSMDAVISSAVLHFAEDEDHFERMLRELWRVLAPGGILFARLASAIGIEDRIVPLGRGRARLPDGTERFVVDEPVLLAWCDRLGADLLEPIKTTNVQGQRCMTTWCLRKRP